MSFDSWIVPALGLGLAGGAMAPFAMRLRRRERSGREAEETAIRFGLHEPVTLHPVVDPERCMGSAHCVDVCPEHVLAVRDGQAVAVAPARCIGHGLCESACPTESIRLVFGTSRRGVDIPRISENFETNVPGTYIVGELGGMGLIRNAFEQGRQCIEGILKEGAPGKKDDAYDAIIVGCGPAGLSASLNCLHHGLRFLTLEKEDIGGTVRYYPRKKLVMTSSFKVPGYGKLDFREVLKEDLVEVWRDIVDRTGLNVNTGETVSGITRPKPGLFEVVTSGERYRTRRVILAIGRRGVPRKLNVPGENSPAVAYALREPEEYTNDRIVIVGGGDSAVEAALALSEQPGNTVRLSYRGEALSRIKEGNRKRIEEASSAGRVELMLSTKVTAIAASSIRYTDAQQVEHTMANDRVFVFIGGEMPLKFLSDCGIEIVTRFGTAA
jgi:thioredoxin reductase/NAD-dependent dihydropyrimidine dehydrogenase PreA subunit